MVKDVSGYSSQFEHYFHGESEFHGEFLCEKYIVT